MKRAAHPPLSPTGQEAFASYGHWLREREDLTPASMRNCLSGLHHFIAWDETDREAQGHDCFPSRDITTPALTRSRAYLQTLGRQKPASVNRSLISLKRYFGWAFQRHLIPYDPSVAVKLVGQEESAPRHLDDQEEQALVAVATKAGNLRDRFLIVLYWLLGTSVQKNRTWPPRSLFSLGMELDGGTRGSCSSRCLGEEVSIRQEKQVFPCSMGCGKPEGCRARGFLSQESFPMPMTLWRTSTHS